MERNMNLIIYSLTVFISLIVVYSMFKMVFSSDENKHKKGCKCLDCRDAE